MPKIILNITDAELKSIADQAAHANDPFAGLYASTDYYIAKLFAERIRG